MVLDLIVEDVLVQTQRSALTIELISSATAMLEIASGGKIQVRLLLLIGYVCFSFKALLEDILK